MEKKLFNIIKAKEDEIREKLQELFMDSCREYNRTYNIFYDTETGDIILGTYKGSGFTTTDDEYIKIFTYYRGDDETKLDHWKTECNPEDIEDMTDEELVKNIWSEEGFWWEDAMWREICIEARLLDEVSEANNTTKQTI